MKTDQERSQQEHSYQELIGVWQEAQNELSCIQVLMEQTDDCLHLTTPHIVRCWLLLARLIGMQNNETVALKAPSNFEALQKSLPGTLTTFVSPKHQERWRKELEAIFLTAQNWEQCTRQADLKIDYRLIELQERCLSNALVGLRRQIDRQHGKNLGALLKRNLKLVMLVAICGLLLLGAVGAYLKEKLSPTQKIALSDLSAELITAGGWNQPGTRTFQHSLEISLPEEISISTIDVSFDNNDKYRIEYKVGRKYKELLELGPNTTPAGGIVRYQQQLETPSDPTNTVRITAVSGDGAYSIGHLRFNRPIE